MISLLLLTMSMTVVAQNQQATGAYTDIYKEYTDDPDVHIFTSNIDYTELAKEITAGCGHDRRSCMGAGRLRWASSVADYP